MVYPVAVIRKEADRSSVAAGGESKIKVTRMSLLTERCAGVNIDT